MLPYKKISNDGMTYHDNCPICKLDRKEWKKNIKPLTEKARIKKYTDNLIKEQLQDYDEETDPFSFFNDNDPFQDAWPIEFEFDDEYDDYIDEHIINPKSILMADNLTLKEYLKMQSETDETTEHGTINLSLLNKRFVLPKKENWLKKLFYKFKTFLLTRFE
ncbi:hypothetical protein [Lactococcus phage Nocturne116]|nr:hypothetical protein [Lactococcus phage Nocturne116]